MTLRKDQQSIIKSFNNGIKYKSNKHRYPLEMHLVHTNTKYADNATEALYNKDGLAVIGVFGYVIPDYINEAFDPVAFAALELSLDSPNEVFSIDHIFHTDIEIFVSN